MLPVGLVALKREGPWKTTTGLLELALVDGEVNRFLE